MIYRYDYLLPFYNEYKFFTIFISNLLFVHQKTLRLIFYNKNLLRTNAQLMETKIRLIEAEKVEDV